MNFLHILRFGPFSDKRGERQVENTPMMPPLVTSYSTASREPSSLAVYDPNLNSLGKQQVVTGYPASSYGFAPLGPLPAPGQPQLVLGQTQYVVQAPVMTRRQKRQARRAQKAADPQRKAIRRKRMKMGAMILGGVILGMILL